MKLVMTILVRDEEDVIDKMIRYHLERGVDYVIATDNRSVDGTRGILERYAQDGCLHLIDEPGEDYRQNVWVTRMARMAATTFDADWIINSDADEFWWPRAGDLKDVLRSVPPANRSIRTPVCHFVPRKDESGAFFDRLVVRQTESREGRDAPLIPPEPAKVAHRAMADVEVRFGNHGVRAAAPLPWWPIQVLHFPIRSYAQLESKIKLFGAAVERYPALGRGSPYKLRLFHLYQTGELADWYAAWVPTEDSIKRSVEAGSMVVDRRLQRFLLARTARPGPHAALLAADLPEDPEALEGAQLRFELERARELEGKKRADESKQAQRLARVKRRASKLERRLEKLQGRLERERARSGRRGIAPGPARRILSALGRLRPARRSG